jgi:histidinol phosphatase-like enzyme
MNFFLFLLKVAGARIDALHYCLHIYSDECRCKKTKMGMVLRGDEDFNIDLKKSYTVTVGDSIRDYLLGLNRKGKFFCSCGIWQKTQEISTFGI